MILCISCCVVEMVASADYSCLAAAEFSVGFLLNGGFPPLATGWGAIGFAQAKVASAYFVFSGEPLSRKAVIFLISGETSSSCG